MSNANPHPTLRAARLWPSSITALAAGLLLLICVTPSQAFGPTGHRVVGRIAQNHLSPEALQAIQEMLGGESLAQAATWPDEIRSDPAYDHTGAWHFVTIEDGQTYETSDKNPEGDVIEAIERFVLQLRDPNLDREKAVIALRWLVHLVGDVHQPLHVGRDADRGGNKIDVVWFGKETNLHVVWDEGLIESTKLSFSELAGFLDRPTPERIERWQNSTVRDWAQESVDYRSRVYEVPEPPPSGRPRDKRGSYKYAYKNLPLVELRLVQGGVRAAGLLNAIFGDEAVEQTEAVAVQTAEIRVLEANGTQPAQQNVSLATLGGTLWAQGGLETRAITISAYHQAQAMLDLAVADTTWTAMPEQEPQSPAAAAALAALPPAIILDADETVLDNSPYQAWLIKENQTYSSVSWNAWVASAKAKAIPGSVDFIDHARKQGVKIFYVTNRDYRGDIDDNGNGTIEPNEKGQFLKPYTVKNLRDVGLLPQEGLSDEHSLLLKDEREGWGSDKTTRRRLLAKAYRIILLVGDSFGDFTGYNFGNHYGSYYDLDAQTRLQEMRKHQHRWARSWIVLPNAMYGSWFPRDPDERLKALDAWDGLLDR